MVKMPEVQPCWFETLGSVLRVPRGEDRAVALRGAQRIHTSHSSAVHKQAKWHPLKFAEFVNRKLPTTPIPSPCPSKGSACHQIFASKSQISSPAPGR
jgi:hypothetical protein